MARTMTISKGTGGGTDYNPGWKELTISSAKYGDYNGTKYLEVSFKGYPENFTSRVYAAMDKNGEEFAIGQVFRFANAGISGGLEGPNGTKIMKMDDDPVHLEDKVINSYFYKDGKYSRVLKQFAPTVFTNEVESFSESDVIYWKGRAENYYEKYVNKGGNSNSFINTSNSDTTVNADDVLF